MAPCSDTYTFQTTTDDGVRLWINGVSVIDQWIDQGATAVNATPVYLTAAAMVPIEMDYFQDYGDASAVLGWSSSTCTAAQVIPQAELYSVMPNTPTPTQSPTPIPSTACPSSDMFNSGSLSPFWTAFDVNPIYPSTITAGTSLTMTTRSFGIQSGTVFGSNTTSDAFSYAVQSISGDFDVALEVDTVPATAGGQMGLMARNTTDAFSAHMYVGACQTGTFQQIYRSAVGNSGVLTTAGAFTSGTPQWVRLVRSVNNFSTYYSANGTTWTQIGTTQTIAMRLGRAGGPGLLLLRSQHLRNGIGQQFRGLQFGLSHGLQTGHQRHWGRRRRPRATISSSFTTPVGDAPTWPTTPSARWRGAPRRVRPWS